MKTSQLLYVLIGIVSLALVGCSDGSVSTSDEKLLEKKMSAPIDGAAMKGGGGPPPAANPKAKGMMGGATSAPSGGTN